MITKEQVIEFFSEEENKPMFHEIAKTQGYESPEEVKGLKGKVEDLIGKNKKLSTERDEYKIKLDEIDIDEYNELKDKKTPDSERLLRKASEETERIKSEKEALTKAFIQREKEHQINSALGAFDDKFKPTIQDALLGKVQADYKDGQIDVYVERDGLQVSFAEYMKDFAENQGKPMLKEQENAGANSISAQNSGGGKTMSREAYDKLNNHDQISFTRGGGVVND